MPQIQWSDDLSVGVELIDNQHKELIRIANVLINAVDKKCGDRVIQNVVKRLRSYTVFHFNSEEKLMQEVHYLRRGEHEKEHAKLKQNVKDYQRTLYERKNLSAENVLGFIKIWLLKHILSADRMLAAHIHERQAQANSQQ